MKITKNYIFKVISLYVYKFLNAIMFHDFLKVVILEFGLR